MSDDDVDRMYAEPLSRQTVERLVQAWSEHIRTGESLDSILGLAGERGQSSRRTQFLIEQRNRHLRDLFHLAELEHPGKTDTELAQLVIDQVAKPTDHVAAQAALYGRTLGATISNPKSLLQLLRKDRDEVVAVLANQA